MIMGTASSERDGPGTDQPTIAEVDTDDDCTSTVNSRPANRPATRVGDPVQQPGREVLAEPGDADLEQRDPDEEHVQQEQDEQGAHRWGTTRPTEG
jgi:hypothetical protein